MPLFAVAAVAQEPRWKGEVDERPEAPIVETFSSRKLPHDLEICVADG